MADARESVAEYVLQTQKLLDQEREAEVGEAADLRQRFNLSRLQRQGLAIGRLMVAELRTGLFGRLVATLSIHSGAKSSSSSGSSGGGDDDNDGRLPPSKISVGDIVDLVSGGSGGQAAAAGNFASQASGVVVRMGGGGVQVAFDTAQGDETERTLDTLASSLTAVAIIKLANTVTYKRLKRTLDVLQNFETPATRVVECMFGAGTPSSGELADFVPLNDGLNASQRAAVARCLVQNEIGVIHGPPGTGKTTTVVELIVQCVRRGERVLACAPSNIAVDNLVERLAAAKINVVRVGHPARLLPSVVAHSLDARLAASDSRAVVQDLRRDMDRVVASMGKAPREQRFALRSELKTLRKELQVRERTAVTEILTQAQVVLGTTTTISPDGAMRHLPADHFQRAIVDEAGQALEVACWTALLRAPRCVLAGDHLQLPPTIMSDEAARSGLAKTLLERVVELHPSCVTMLTTQYRMHEDIMGWSSAHLYGGQLEAHESVRNHLLCDLPGVEATEETETSLIYIDTAGCNLDEMTDDDGLSKCNPGEVSLVYEHVKRLVAAGVSGADIGIITPYNLQVEQLMEKIKPEHPAVEIRSVDGFQGREKEAIIVSLVRSNRMREVGFLADQRRMNVAITRARRHAVVVGNSDTVSSDANLRSLVDHLHEHALLLSAFEYIADVETHADARLKASDANRGKRRPKPISQTAEEREQARKAHEERLAADEQEVATRKEQFRQELEQFLASDAEELRFPPSLTSAHRRLIHMLCEELNIFHSSQGEKDQRHVLVRRSAPEVPEEATAEEVEPTVTRTEGRAGDSHAGAAASTSAGEDQRNGAAGPAPDSSSAAATCSEPSAKAAARAAGEGDGSRQPNPETAAAAAGASPASSSAAAAEPATEPGMEVCEVCRKAVPAGNFDIHVIRCERMHRRAGAMPESGGDSKVAGSVDVRMQASRGSTSSSSSGGGSAGGTAGGKKSSGKKAAAATAATKKSTKKAAAETEAEVDALLEAMAKDAGECQGEGCHARVRVLGFDCQFCRRRFCSTHAIPEVHGCSEAMRRHAQAEARHAAATLGSAKGTRPKGVTRDAHNQALARKLHKAIQDKVEARTGTPAEAARGAEAKAKQKAKKKARNKK